VYIYLSNEGSVQQDVFFDDFKVTHTKSPIVQQDDYYPFGLTFNSYQRENATPNRWKFQGQEHVDDLGLNWDSFKWRNHQPDIGRFFNVDPLAEKYYYNSPYAFSENKVVAHVEIEGLEAAEYLLKQEIQKKADYVMTKYDQAVEKTNEVIESVGSFLYGLVGWVHDVPKESTDKQQDGMGINIYDESGAGADNKYVPSPDPNSRNFDLEKSVLDGVLQSTKSPSPSTPSDIGERVKNVATAVDKGVKAEQKAEKLSEKKSSNDQSKNAKQSQQVWTYDSIKVEWGNGDSTSWIINKK
jgi:RHS repeat-associated protein